MRLTLENIKQHIPKLGDSDARELVEKINMIGQNKIDVSEILTLLMKDSAELDKEYKEVENKRQELKLEISRKILGG